MEIVFLPRHDAFRPGEIRTECQGTYTGITGGDQIVEFRQRARAGGAVHHVPAPAIRRCVPNAVEENKSLRRDVLTIFIRLMQRQLHRVYRQPVFTLKVATAIVEAGSRLAADADRLQQTRRNRTLFEIDVDVGAWHHSLKNRICRHVSSTCENLSANS